MIAFFLFSLPVTRTAPCSSKAADSSHAQQSNNKQKKALILVLSVNDPSAGSPTETLLRLLLPLDEKV